MKTGSRNLARQRSSPPAKVGSPVGERQPTTRQVSNHQRSPHRGYWWALLLLLGSAASLTGIIWLSVRFIVNPQAVGWLHHWLPVPTITTRTGLKPPQSLQSIQAEMRQRGYIAGEAISLGQNTSFLDGKSNVTDLLLPMMARRANCQQDCDRIVELQLYQSTPLKTGESNHEASWQLIRQLAIAGPEESSVIAPFVDAESANQGSARPLPLVTLSRFDRNTPSFGTWLNVSGQWSRHNETVTYGQVIHYNPTRFHLSTMLQWISPAGEQPIWREVTGGGTPELLVNQTITMEPYFQIYQVTSRRFLPNPLQLEAISLMADELNDFTYRKALLLARNGLWSTSSTWLQAIRQKRIRQPGKWSAALQAQIDLVQWHAQLTRSQAEQSWASPAQQVLANLIDGRWERAIQVFDRSPDDRLETIGLLRTDAGRIQNRVEAALQMNPTQTSAKTWGTLLIAAQKSRGAAIGWLKKQPKTSAKDISRIDALLRQIEQLQSDN